MTDPRPTSELAADVRTGLNFGPVPLSERGRNILDVAAAALDALVARITDLEAHLAEAEQRLDQEIVDGGDLEEKLEAAEAQVAALTAELEGENYILRSTHDAITGRLAAEVAALATTRQALVEIERMAGAAGPGETPAAPLASIARRALAATDTTKEEE